MSHEVEIALEAADIAQQAWSNEIVRQRMKKVGKVAGQIANRYPQFLTAIARPHADDAQKLASEVLPLADACRYTSRIGRRTLAPQTASFRHGAWWMGRIGVLLTRQPWGTVLVVAPSNYPLFLPGVQIIQALAAGNAVVVKPAPGGQPPLEVLKECTVEAGIPADLLQILPTAIETGQEVMRRGVDRVVLTGSARTGRAVLQQLADTLTPATMELSGCDAVFVLPQADLARVARAVAFALQLNGGATCIAPRRIFAIPAIAPQLVELLAKELAHGPQKCWEVPVETLRTVRSLVSQAVASGAELAIGSLPAEGSSSMTPLLLRKVTPGMAVARADLFAPVASVLEVKDMAAALAADRECPYSLGASVFGPTAHAEHLASQIAAGCVVINDCIVPTADPRVAFGGRDLSGWGVTRGAEGLLEMTRPKTLCTRHGKWLPHLDPEQAGDAQILGQLLQLFHAEGLMPRLQAIRQIVRLSRRKPNRT